VRGDVVGERATNVGLFGVGRGLDGRLAGKQGLRNGQRAGHELDDRRRGTRREILDDFALEIGVDRIGDDSAKQRAAGIRRPAARSQA
jgi:hypothetical protein